jgi:hypothetical protein
VFELGQRSAARSGQAKLKTAKPSYRWEAAKRPILRGGLKDSACFETGARMDSFAVVLPTPGYSSMYEAKCQLTNCIMSNVVIVEHVSV